MAGQAGVGRPRASSSAIRQPSLRSRPSPPSLPHLIAVHRLLPLGVRFVITDFRIGRPRRNITTYLPPP
ncbi:hypothetical protein ACET3X_004338 [Alternaria dauci]|uniref:Uncharacterized protein n=1 Tax=Alternaria dauci TaxID=48095 RepID=A0ABR3UN73_9PLEO